MSAKKNAVLICDDRMDMRCRIRKALENLPHAEILDIDHPSKVERELEFDERIRLLILDLRFPSTLGASDMRIIGHKILPQLHSDFPHVRVIVLTTVGAKEGMDILIEAFRRHLIDDWINVGEAFTGEEVYARAYKLLYPMGDVSENGLWLTHLSDMHFGNSERFAYWGLAEDGGLLEAILDDQKRVFPEEVAEYPKKNDVIVVCGDSTHRGRDPEFTKAAHFLAGLWDATTPAAKRTSGERLMVVVPGNHDLNFDISRARCIYGEPAQYHELHSEQDVPEELGYLRPYVWAPFERFSAELQLRPPTIGTHWCIASEFASAEWAFPEYGLAVTGFNSCAKGVSHCQNEPSIASSTLRDLDQARDIDKNIKAALPMIAVCHHSLGSGPASDKRVCDDEIREMRAALVKKFGVRIAMTGHVHHEVIELLTVGDQNILAIGAGSSGGSKTQGHANLQYNIIRMIPGGTAGYAEATVMVYPRLRIDGEFVHHPRRPQLTYRWTDDHQWLVV